MPGRLVGELVPVSCILDSSLVLHLRHVRIFIWVILASDAFFAVLFLADLNALILGHWIRYCIGRAACLYLSRQTSMLIPHPSRPFLDHCALYSYPPLISSTGLWDTYSLLNHRSTECDQRQAQQATSQYIVDSSSMKHRLTVGLMDEFV